MGAVLNDKEIGDLIDALSTGELEEGDGVFHGHDYYPRYLRVDNRLYNGQMLNFMEEFIRDKGRMTMGDLMRMVGVEIALKCDPESLGWVSINGFKIVEVSFEIPYIVELHVPTPMPLVTDKEIEELQSCLSPGEVDACFNMVSRPRHYTEGRKYEPRKVIYDWGLNFNLGNAVKYISRAGRKNDAVEDLKKAKQYLEFELEERMKGDQNETS